MIVRFEFGYNDGFDEEERKKLEEFGIEFNLYKRDNKWRFSDDDPEKENGKTADQKYEEYIANEPKQINLKRNEHVADISVLLSAFPKKKIQILSEVKTTMEYGSAGEVFHRFENLVNNMMETASLFNEKVNVHIGGSSLMMVDTLLLLENCCTDVVQEGLNSGWRIIAVNVQADGRRPDYILGRHSGMFTTNDAFRRSEDFAAAYREKTGK